MVNVFHRMALGLVDEFELLAEWGIPDAIVARVKVGTTITLRRSHLSCLKCLLQALLVKDTSDLSIGHKWLKNFARLPLVVAALALQFVATALWSLT